MIYNLVVALATLSVASAFAPVTNVRSSSLQMFGDRSEALPFDARPANLDGSLPGDVGFDPAGFTNNPPKQWLVGGEERSLKWYREAEIVHGRIAQMAVIGNIVPAWIHLPGNPDLGIPDDAFAQLNPYKALESVPEGGLWQISLLFFGIELARLKRIIRGDKEPGDLGLGQTGYNPFGFEYTPEEYREKQVQEIKHGRLAMFAAIGILLQAKFSGLGVTEQLGEAFTWLPEREILQGPGVLGDYFPPNL